MGDVIDLNGVESKDRLLSPIFLNLLVSLILSCVPIIDKHEGTFLSVRFTHLSHKSLSIEEYNDK